MPSERRRAREVPRGPTFRRILVPLDGSSHGEQALPYALTLANRASAPIELVHVHDPAETPYGPGDVEEAGERRARAYLEAVAESLRGLSRVPLAVTLLEGPIARSVLERARAASVDLVVLTTHGMGPLSRAWFGSVADELIRSARVPLLVVRPEEDEADLASERVLRRILVPLDGSELAEQALGPALALGAWMDAEYELLRVARPAREPGPDPFFSPARQVPDEEAEAEARAYLQGVQERLARQTDRPVSVRVDSAGSVAQAIIDIGNARMFDLIGLSTQGRRRLSRMLLGSVADKVVRGASVPVLVHRPAASRG
jgi:nucleotide-binding universal stress UspA family protein